MNKIKISNHQLTILTSGYVFGSAPLLISSSVVDLAGQDAWISAILATLMGLVVVLINSFLGELYPEKTLIQVIQLLFGKWLGGFVSACFIFVALLATCQVIWYASDFMETTYMPEESTYPINIIFIAVLLIAMLYGLEATSRAIELFFSILFPLYIISMAALLPNIKIDNLQPILENGISPVFKGTIPLLGFTVFPIVMLNMIFPANITNVKEGKKSLFKGSLLGMFIASISILMCVLVLGSVITANSRFPLFNITQVISIGSIFTRVEAVMVFIWLTTNFISAFFYFYSSTIGLAQLLKLKDYKNILLPLGLILAVYSDFIYENVIYEIDWDSNVWIPLIFTFGVLLPVILLLTSVIKKAINKN